MPSTPDESNPKVVACSLACSSKPLVGNLNPLFEGRPRIAQMRHLLLVDDVVTESNDGADLLRSQHVRRGAPQGAARSSQTLEASYRRLQAAPRRDRSDPRRRFPHSLRPSTPRRPGGYPDVATSDGSDELTSMRSRPSLHRPPPAGGAAAPSSAPNDMRHARRWFPGDLSSRAACGCISSRMSFWD